MEEISPPFLYPVEIHMENFDFQEEMKELLRACIRRDFEGEFSAHEFDSVFIRRTQHPLSMRFEGFPIYSEGIPQIIKSWAKLDLELEIALEDMLFLDLETSGLGRSGTLAFMIGLGYYEEGHFVVEQIFLPDPDAEENSFDRLRELIESRSLILSFNGKSFDIPVLESRLLYHHIWLNLRDIPHLDVLHLARRMWKRRLSSCALESIEYYILDHPRCPETDIPGAQVPQAYQDFLYSGETSLISRIFEHNHDDILYLAILFALIADNASYPPKGGKEHRIDYHALARLYESVGEIKTARRIMIDLISEGFVNADIAYDLGMILKREKDYPSALEAFEMAAELSHAEAMTEAAIILERDKCFEEALKHSLKAQTFEKSRYRPNENKLEALSKRIKRLEAKLNIEP